MTKEADDLARKSKLDLRTAAIKKARARLRKSQRHDQARRQQKVAEVLEGALGRKFEAEDVELLRRVLATASASLSLQEVLGAILTIRERCAGETGPAIRRELAARADAFAC
jgi:hypothetical protein